MTLVLNVQGAIKSYGGTPALCGADLTLARGQWLGLLGPNGAGKTTLVRAIAGRVRLDGGTITLFDTPLNGNPGAAAAAARGRLGIVPQEIALYPLLTARENLAGFGRLNGVGRDRLPARIDRALEFAGLSERADDRVKTFSGGMKRRLNIACAILHEPELLLLDEPTVGVDPQSRQRIWEMLDELRRGGASILLTTHGLEEAQQVCETITIIDHGKAIAAGTFPELLRQTIGASRRVVVRAELDDDQRRTLAADGRLTIGPDGVIEASIDNVAADLSALLRDLAAANVPVRDLHIEAPGLQAVFLHLTGRELRE